MYTRSFFICGFGVGWPMVRVLMSVYFVLKGAVKAVSLCSCNVDGCL